MDVWRNQRSIRCGVAIAAALAVSAGCSERATERRTAAPAARMDLGVVSLSARIGGDVERSAGAVIDSARGLVLTTAHGVWGATSLKVTTGLAVLHGRILARDACDDLALVETQPRLPGLVALPAAADGTVASNAPLVAVQRRGELPTRGTPDLITVPVRAESAAAGTELLSGIRPAGAVPLAAAEALVSGAPLLGADGRLTGLVQVVERGGRARAIALPWETITARLQELDPGGSAVYVGWRRYYRCAGALHRYTAARHPGFRTGDARLNAPVPATRLPGTEEVDG